MVQRTSLSGWLPIALLLVGCAPDGEETAAMLRHALASTQVSAAMTGTAAATPTAAAAPNAAASPSPGVSRTARPFGAPRDRGTAPPGAAAALMGVSADQLRRMLGEPSIRRPEGAAEVWLYEAPACRLDVILYAEGTALTVGHAAARALGGTEGVTESACLAAVAAAPSPAPWTAPAPRA